MNPRESAGKRRVCLSFVVEPEALAHYGRMMRLASSEAALQALASAVASSPGWRNVPATVIVIRTGPQPMLTVIGHFDPADEAWLEAQAYELNRACLHMHYIGLAEVEQECEQLATQLVACFGPKELRRFHFTAIPRGGFIVLGMLAYALGLEQDQLKPPHPPDVPLVVVDDCALTGARFGRFLAQCTSRQVVFGHLYSHADLRAALEAQEPRVISCVSARNLHDHGPERLGDKYPAWRERWLARMPPPRYWIGQPDHLCFAWSEPDRVVWNPVTKRVESAWHTVPPELCLKNRLSTFTGAVTIPIQVQPSGKGPLRPSEQAIFAELKNEIVVGNPRTGQSFALTDVAADMWRAIVEFGNLEDVTAAMLRDYDVDSAVLEADLHAFVGTLLTRGVLERNDAGPSSS